MVSAVRSHQVLFRTIGKAQVLGFISGQAKIITTVQGGRVPGVHMVGPHVIELIAEGTLAVQMGCSAKDIAQTIHAHPTLPKSMAEVAYLSIAMLMHN